MKSIQTKIILLILCCTMMSASVVLVVSFANTGKTLDEDSDKILNLLCAEKASQINETLRDIEQSVNTLYSFAVGQIGDVDRLLEDAQGLSSCLQKVREVAANAAENTEGAIAVYFRFAPEISTPVTGLFLTRQDTSQDFTDMEITDLSKYDSNDIERVGWYYLPIREGGPIWMDPYQNKNIDIEMISYVIPIFNGEEAVGVVGMDIDVSLLSNKVSETVVYDSGYAFLLDSAGNMVYHRDYPNGIKRAAFVGDLQKVQGMLLEAQETEGLYSYEWYGVRKQMVSQRLVNGMSLAIAVPVKEVEAPKWKLLAHSLLLVLLVLGLCIILITRWVRSIIRPLKQLTEAAKKIAQGDLKVSIECNSSDEVGVLAQSFRQTAKSLNEYIEYINRLAYTDALTGIRNKTAYEDNVTYLEDAIKRECAEFAVVVMDINNLKLMNDVYGHEKGDMLIMDAAGIMKKVFGVNMIYRVGGDEFVAILTADQIQRRRELMNTFAREIDKFNRSGSKRYESELQIAGGVAVYDREQDKCYADVFRRADILMYKNKKMLKEQ